jgi:hypothetical protein
MPNPDGTPTWGEQAHALEQSRRAMESGGGRGGGWTPDKGLLKVLGLLLLVSLVIAMIAGIANNNREAGREEEGRIDYFWDGEDCVGPPGSTSNTTGNNQNCIYWAPNNRGDAPPPGAR